MNAVGDVVGRIPSGRSDPRGETAPPQTRRAGSTALSASYVFARSAEVGGRRRDRPVGRELRQPEAVQVRLVADDDVVEARQGDGEGGGVLRELRLGDRIERRRRRAGRVDRDVDLDAREPCGRLDVTEDLELAGRRRGETGSPVGGDADGRHSREAQLGHLRLRRDEIRRAHGVLGGAERHRRAACERRPRERENRADRAGERGQDAPQGGGTLAPMREDSVREQLKRLPTGPGVYLFRDERDEILYVGKAKSLRARVRSYWNRGGDTRAGIGQLVERVHRIEVIVTQSEAEALHLEQNLVKRHRPPFNVRLRDDKSFPYIAVTVSDSYPRVMFTRERHRRDTVYFGPYANAKKVRETLDVLNRVFQFRPCEGPKPGRHSGIPCLDFHIERCTAPCIGAISEEDYGAIVDGVIEFLSGETRPIRRALERRMRDAAAEERFEEAARYRNRLRAIESLAQRQAADKQAVGTIDVVGLAVDGDRAAVQLFPLRDGKLVDRFAFHLENVAGQDRATILESFCVEHYGSAPAVPPQVIVPSDIEDTEALAAFLGDLRGARVEVRAPQRGEKRRLAALAEENARLALEHDLSAREQRRQRRVEALEQLRESLNLESLPVRIECFDVSNIQGSEIVASMSVFVDAESKRAHYRTFAVRGLEGQDDFAAMGQVVARRFARLRDAAAPDRYDESFASIPNLVVIDGGKGQLAAALEAIHATYDLPRVAVVALAKREEEVFVPGRSAPVRLERHDPGLQLLQRARDEAHRFALGFHRRRRDTRAFESIFDDLEGIGPARRRAILRHFGSADSFLAASQEELEGVPGLPARTARAVYAQLHKAGRG